MKEFESDSLALHKALTTLRKFYEQSLSWVVPQYAVLEETIADEVRSLARDS
jgi:hypothetical protein